MKKLYCAHVVLSPASIDQEATFFSYYNNYHHHHHHRALSSFYPEYIDYYEYNIYISISTNYASIIASCLSERKIEMGERRRANKDHQESRKHCFFIISLLSTLSSFLCLTASTFYAKQCGSNQF